MNLITKLAHRQDLKKIEIKCAKRGDFDYIHYAIMAKVIFFLNYSAILKCYFFC